MRKMKTTTRRVKKAVVGALRSIDRAVFSPFRPILPQAAPNPTIPSYAEPVLYVAPPDSRFQASIQVSSPSELAMVDDQSLTWPVAYVISLRAYFKYDRASFAPANNISVIATRSGIGRWVRIR